MSQIVGKQERMVQVDKYTFRNKPAHNYAVFVFPPGDQEHKIATTVQYFETLEDVRTFVEENDVQNYNVYTSATFLLR